MSQNQQCSMQWRTLKPTPDYPFSGACRNGTRVQLIGRSKMCAIDSFQKRTSFTGVSLYVFYTLGKYPHEGSTNTTYKLYVYTYVYTYVGIEVKWIAQSGTSSTDALRSYAWLHTSRNTTEDGQIRFYLNHAK